MLKKQRYNLENQIYKYCKVNKENKHKIIALEQDKIKLEEGIADKESMR